MKIAYTGLFILISAALFQAAYAQDLTNNGATISLVGGATLYTSGSLTNGSGTLDLSNGANQLTVSGNLVNASAATLTPGTASVVTLNGSTAQQLNLNGASLNNLTIANTSGGVRLPASSYANVAGALTLTSGLVTVDPSSRLLLLNGATLSGEQNTSYVRGPLAAVKANVLAGATTTFPNSFTLTSSATLTNLTVTRLAGLNTAQTSYGTNASGSSQGIDRIWQTSAPVTGQVVMKWLPTNDNGLTNLAQSQPWARAAAPVAGSGWSLVGPSQNASTSRTIQANVPVGSNFSFFTVSTSEAPLPITLVAFTAQAQGADGLLKWTTASELRNDYFQVESSPDGVAFQALGRVAGHGTSAQAHDYQLLDKNLARYGVSTVYYRLRQVDVDGTTTYSPVRTLAVNPAANWLAQVYPNPSAAAAALTLLVRIEQAGIATLTLSDVLGRQLSQQQLSLPQGESSWPLAGSAQLATGVYLLRVQQGPQTQVLKLVRQ